MADDNTVSIRIMGAVDASLTASAAEAKTSLTDLAAAGNTAAGALDGNLKEGFLDSALAATRMAGEVAGLGEKLSSANFIGAASDIAGIATSLAELGPALGPAAAIGAIAGGLGYLAYQSLAAQKDMDGLAEGFALTGRGATNLAAAVKAEIDALSAMPGVTSAAAQAIVQWETAHGEVSAQINNAVDQLLPQFTQWLGDKAPEAVGRLKEQLQTMASGSSAAASQALKELVTSAHLVPASVAPAIEAMITAKNRTGAWTTALLDLAKNGGGHIESLKAQIADTSAQLKEAQSEVDGLNGVMESGLGAVREAWLGQAVALYFADEKVQEFTAHLKSLRATLATSTVTPQIPMSELDRYTATLQRNANLAGEPPKQRVIDSALIEAATKKLEDQGNAEKTVVTNAAQATQILGAQQSALIASLAAAGEKPAASGGTGNDAAKAKEQADQIIAINRQLQDAIVEGAKQSNDSQLALGQESLGQWTAQALAQANAKYDAAVQGYQREAATGKLSHAAMLADMALADQQWSNEVNAIWDQTAEKQRQIDQKNLSDFIKSENDKLAAATKILDGEVKAHQLSAMDRDAAEAMLTQAIEDEVLKRWDADHAGLVKGTDAYKAAMAQRAELVAEFGGKVEAANIKLTDDQLEQWRTTDQAIESAESQLVSDIFSKRQGLGEDLRQIALKELEQEIQDDLKALTEHEMANLGMLASDQKTAQEGMLAHAAEWGAQQLGLMQPSTSAAGAASGALSQATQQVAQQGALTANTSALTALTAALTSHGLITTTNTGAIALGTSATASDATVTATHVAATAMGTLATSGNTVASLTNTPAIVANTGAQSVSLFAWIENTAATVANTLATDIEAIAALNPFASGSDNIPFDMPAYVHQGEMIIPADVAEKVRAGNYHIGNLGNLADLAANNNLTPVDLGERSFGSVGSRSAAFSGADNTSLGGGTSIGGDTHYNMSAHFSGFDLSSIAHSPAFQREAIKVMKNMHRNAVAR